MRRERLQRGGGGEKLGEGVVEASGVSLRFVSFMKPLCVRTQGLTLAARWLSLVCLVLILLILFNNVFVFLLSS